MSLLLFSDYYEDILESIAKWRIVDLKRLMKVVDYPHSYQAFAQRIKRLEELGYVQSFFCQQFRKYIYLTRKGLIETSHHKSNAISDENIRHDIVVSNTLRELLKMSSITKGRINNGNKFFNKYVPDAWIEGKNSSGDHFEMIVEVELTQKSRSRIQDKMKYFYRLPKDEFVIYIFQKPSIFETYKDVIQFIDNHPYDNPKERKLFQTVIMIIEPSIKDYNFNLLNSYTFFNKKIRKFGEIVNV